MNSWNNLSSYNTNANKDLIAHVNKVMPNLWNIINQYFAENNETKKIYIECVIYYYHFLEDYSKILNGIVNMTV